ncbi:MAG: DUF2127 domain-containing protein [Actinomycetota bacterium]|nr:DUF2127 domain-containing protein [Actinomycetota bacterium]
MRRRPWWLPEGWHAETWVCSMRGHVCPPTADDERLARGELLRCVRCDAWVSAEAVDRQAEGVPWPRRGKELHEAIVLRFVALDRAFHAVILIPAGLILGWLWLRLGVLSPQARGLAEGLASVSKQVGHVGGLLNSAADRVATLNRGHVFKLAIAALAFGLVEATEAVGLWLEKRWAEYLTVVATASLLPLEVIELTHHVTVLKAFGFVLNIAVVAYLLWAKRLFGIRGGVAAHNVDVEAILSRPNPQKARPASGTTPQPS